jgi:3'(2'), 5'-bisphosphate nucleotidase
LIRAAGGVATDVDGSPLDFSTGKIINNQGIIATNGHIHTRVIEAVQKLLAEEKAVHSEN